jgi:hypothetical protein
MVRGGRLPCILLQQLAQLALPSPPRPLPPLFLLLLLLPPPPLLLLLCLLIGYGGR